MSWEIFVQVWLFTIVGFVVGVVLTWLIGVLPLRKKLARRTEEANREARRRASEQGQTAPPKVSRPSTARSEGVATLAAPAVEGEAPRPAEPTRTAEPVETPPEPPRPATKQPIAEERPEEQTVVLEAFDFGGPDSRSQTRDLVEEEEDEEPWRPEVRIDPNDRLSDQLAKRAPQPEPQAPQQRPGDPGMFDPAGAEPSHLEPRSAEPVTSEPSSFEPSVFEPEPEPEAHPEPTGSSAMTWLQPGEFEQARPGESSQGQSFSFLDEPREPAATGFPEPFPAQQRAEPVAEPAQDDEPALPRRTPGAAAAAVDGGPLAAASSNAGGGSLFDPSAELDAESGGSAPVGPFGPGSALPRPDGSAPAPEFRVKARTSSMVFHTEQSPFFDRLLPQVWFRDVDDAARAGFTSWDRPN
ncbi:hypothetical protein [Sciscionella sediminilitoris]|uniref:sunset domain-containing protein n=1 Tax=Sciscionella sediminilitoris TaxID=1445613 RepID=UPI0004DEECE9|nr:hypothetical protein [Sciscionella sp. SE31]